MEARAAGLADELKQEYPDATVRIEEGQERSEFAILLDGKKIYSRLANNRRFPDLDELLDILDD